MTWIFVYDVDLCVCLPHQALQTLNINNLLFMQLTYTLDQAENKTLSSHTHEETKAKIYIQVANTPESTHGQKLLLPENEKKYGS